ncbi:LytTR family DNA-binding domain-containing protein [Metasolibacillus meyeri]|uniref:LytTR family DNA-binding domain-containing protein n=1 Tax=Metasolibacillus meyeri TaxID=1071052 RepID=A0AAW9NMI6_9BACL|nr:LytTR family DNA-binding domain-containing protein [Metasolibacillus meyeri]MEC1178605.1 LytTR family DNA-binding domain-containing protein [Metasolibacillus meyeri]
MRIAIYEDDIFYQQLIVETVKNYALFQAPSVQITSCTKQPLIEAADCYILDIELNSSVNGLDIAQTIRQQDPLAHIIFITTYAQYLTLTFKYKLAALDFIVKDSPSQIQADLTEALQAAFTKYQQLGAIDQTKWFQIKTGEKVKNIAIEDIYFFETATQPHKIKLYERNGCHSFYGSLKELDLGDGFFRSHKSFLVHLKNMKEVNFKKRKIIMENGSYCPIAFRSLTALQKVLQDN